MLFHVVFVVVASFNHPIYRFLNSIEGRMALEFGILMGKTQIFKYFCKTCNMLTFTHVNTLLWLLISLIID